MRAAGGLDRNRRAAFRAFSGRDRRRFLFFLEPVHLLDHNENGEGHDEEIQDGVDEYAVFQGHQLNLGGLGDLFPEGNRQI